jgi:F-type H+-transporting ATPase subunit delta
MRDRKVATRYAQALLEAAKEQAVLGEVAESYVAVAEAFKDRSDLAIFMESPQVATQEKHKLIDDVLAARVEPVFVRFLHLIIDKNRIEYFRDIGEEFIAMVESEQGIQRAEVVTAVPLASDLELALTEKLQKITGASIILEKKVDAAVLGGVCVTLGDKILDGTVRTNLDLLQKHLGQAPVH